MKPPAKCSPSLPPSHPALTPTIRLMAQLLSGGNIDSAVAVARQSAAGISVLAERAGAGDAYATRVMTVQGWNAMDASDWIAWLVGRANELEESQGLKR